MARFGAFSACRESFVPLWLAQHRAGRILYRMRGGDGARQHNSTPGATGMEGTGGSGGIGGTTGPGRGAGGGAGPGRITHKRQQHPAQANFACNSIGPNFNKPRKRWDSNDTTSISKTVSGELHATLMIDSQNWATCSNPGPGHTTSRRTTDKAQHRGREPAGPRPPDATTQTRTLRSTCVRSRSARAARRSRRSSRSLRLRRRAGRRR